ncbi:glycosyltransferase family 2 protein [Paenibacillus vulneris]|uniref:Glycosyltransferase family 2 protein n=1 Tax=Paenibacillus vulneris TaxID=1133364 RepID=A0ABW3UFI8_9BACL
MKTEGMPILSIVVPCFNEEEVLHETAIRLTDIIKNLIQRSQISNQSIILFVDDGSRDSTWSIIEQLNKENIYIKGLKLAKNVGHQNALLAGLNKAREFSDCVISIDADLQDDVNSIYEFIAKYHEGFDIVYGVRRSRESDTFFKRNTALAFYRIMEKMGVNIVHNHADYRLLSKRALDHFVNFKEVNLFIRGIIPLIGFTSTEVYYDRNERFAGESKYPIKKMLAFALEGITSFSITPIRLVTLIGSTIFFISFIAGAYALIAKLIGNVVSGWTSIILSIWFIGGIQLIALGLLGEYIGKIYKEVKNRPKYCVDIDLTLNENELITTKSKDSISIG